MVVTALGTAATTATAAAVTGAASLEPGAAGLHLQASAAVSLYHRHIVAPCTTTILYHSESSMSAKKDET